MPDDKLDWNSEWNVVDEASLESFPASDPPAWGSSHAAAEPAAPAYVDEPEEVTIPLDKSSRAKAAGEKAYPWMAYLRRAGYGFLALGATFAVVLGVRRLRHAHA